MCTTAEMLAAAAEAARIEAAAAATKSAATKVTAIGMEADQRTTPVSAVLALILLR